MGKRKSAKKPEAKKAPKLPTSFDCPFCNHSGSVEIKMNHRKGHSTLTCVVCSTGFSMGITSLDDPIDVYHEWIDQCVAANKLEGHEGGGDHSEAHPNYPPPHTQRPALHPADEADDDDDDDGFIVRDDLHGEEADGDFFPASN
eukprot:RCo008839